VNDNWSGKSSLQSTHNVVFLKLDKKLLSSRAAISRFLLPLSCTVWQECLRCKCSHTSSLISSVFYYFFSSLSSYFFSFFFSAAYFFLCSIYSGVNLTFSFLAFFSSFYYSGFSSFTYLALYWRLNLTGSWKSSWQVPHWCCLPKVSKSLKSIFGP